MLEYTFVAFLLERFHSNILGEVKAQSSKQIRLKLKGHFIKRRPFN